MSDECEEAQKQLRLAKERLEKAEYAMEDAGLTTRQAEGEHQEATYEYDRALVAAKGFDERVSERAADVAAAQAEYERYEDTDAINREALLGELRDKLADAEAAHREAQSDSERAWSRATELASEQEHKLTAVTRATIQLESAEADVAGARSEVDAAAREADRACP
jgi:hypothetical protein